MKKATNRICCCIYDWTDFLILGYYFIDPNGGGSDDAIVAHCNFEKAGEVETCVNAVQTSYELKDWVPTGQDAYKWFMWDIQTTFDDKVNIRANFYAV